MQGPPANAGTPNSKTRRRKLLTGFFLLERRGLERFGTIPVHFYKIKIAPLQFT